MPGKILDQKQEYRLEGPNIKADLLLENDLDAAFDKDLVFFDWIPMDLLFKWLVWPAV